MNKCCKYKLQPTNILKHAAAISLWHDYLRKRTLCHVAATELHVWCNCHTWHSQMVWAAASVGCVDPSPTVLGIRTCYAFASRWAIPNTANPVIERERINWCGTSIQFQLVYMFPVRSKLITRILLIFGRSYLHLKQKRYLYAVYALENLGTNYDFQSMCASYNCMRPSIFARMDDRRWTI